MQGIGVGGEWGGAVLMATEHAPKGKAGLYGAAPQMGVPAGVVLANVVFLLHQLMTEEQFTSWGWRVPFLLSATLVMVAMWIRLGVMESPAFEAVEKEDRIAKSRSSRSSPRAGEPCCSPAAPSSPPTASPTSSWCRCSATAPPSSATAAAPCSPC